MQNLRVKIDQTQARIDALTKEHRSNLEAQTKVDDLKTLKKNLQDDHKKVTNKLVDLQKTEKTKNQRTSRS